VIADDATIVRAGLGAMLAEGGVETVAEVGDADALLEAVERCRPDAAVVDIRMPPTHTDEGIVAARQIRERHPRTGVLVLSQALESSYAMRLLAENPSSVGYLLKERVADVTMLVDALHRVVAGESVVDPAIVQRLLAQVRRSDPLAALTEREREVLAAMAEGRSNQGIGATLFLSDRTIETHVSRIFTKLDLAEVGAEDNRRVLAVLTYLREGNPDATSADPRIRPKGPPRHDEGLANRRQT
jgi:DNA-binding NarL/FixJ family response regulator